MGRRSGHTARTRAVGERGRLRGIGGNRPLEAAGRGGGGCCGAGSQGGCGSAAPEVPLTPEEEADAIGEDDVVLEEDSRSHTDLLIETLGAQIITEEPN